MKFKGSILTALLITITTFVFCQTGSITGVVVDKKTRETLVGASVVITGTINGAITDFDGKYNIAKLKAGSYDITISFIAYNSIAIKGVTVVEGKPTLVNVEMESGGKDIKTIEVTAEANRQTSVSLMNTLQTNVGMASGISQETIRRSPDRNVGEVLKRVSGISVNENKFVIVRGLSDRYNFGILNNMPLASTEPDRKTIAFDIFPANVIDNIIVSKTATPDLPGEFAGGVVQINTRDVPYENSYTINISGSENSQSTFNDYYKYGNAKTNWLGQDNGDRKLPIDFTASETFKRLTPSQKAEQTKLLANDWQLNRKNNLPINRTMQVGVSQRFKLFKNEGGIIVSGTYGITNKMVNVTDRNDFDTQNRLFHYTDTMFNTNITGGLIANLAYKIGKQGKFTFKNLFSTNSTERTILRSGINDNAARLDRANTNELTVTNLYTTQAGYEHTFLKSGAKLSIGYSYTNLNRDVPNLRKMLFSTADLYDTTVYYAQVPFGSANPALAGQFYSKLNDHLNTWKMDFSIPLDSKRIHVFKTGLIHTKKDRTFDARVLGYVLGNPQNYNLLLLPQDSLFMTENIDPKKFRIDDITNPTDKYAANFVNQAAYIMADNLVAKKLRFIYGVRYEKYDQELFAKFSSTDSVVKNTFENLLPSVNIIYSANAKHKIRAAFSQTVSRPEFREIVPFAFYDFIEVSTVLGNDSLVSTTINNFDLKYEFFPTDGQVISVTGFYKKFTDPIETIFDLSSGGGSRTYTFSNVQSAENVGVELDFRVKLSSMKWLAASKFCNNFTAFSNVALIKSKIDLSNIPQAYESERPLQGQSPYVVNIGLDYRTPKSGWGITLLYNKIGNRVIVTGSNNNPDIIQAAREQLDISISKKFLKYCEARLVLSDILNRPDVFYQDLNKDGKYIAENDNLMRRFVYGYGTSFSLLFKY